MSNAPVTQQLIDNTVKDNTENHYSEVNITATDKNDKTNFTNDDTMYLNYLDDYPKSLVRNDDYFITLAKQNKSLWPSSQPVHQI